MPSARPKRQRVWVMAKTLSPQEKAAITTTCDRFISGVLKPKFLPEIRPTEFNYPVDIFGKWRGENYSFIVRFRSGFPKTKAMNSILALRASTTRLKALRRAST